MPKKRVNKLIKLKKKNKSESIIPYILILVLISLTFIFYFSLFSLGGWIGIVIGLVITLYVLNKKWYS
jgi:hypothetical protein